MKNQSLSNQTHQEPQAEQTFLVTIKPITDPAKRKSLQEAIARVDHTDQQLAHFFNTIYSGHQQANELFATLQAANIIREEQGRERNDESVNTYLSLLQAIKSEIEKERIVLLDMLNTQEEKTIEIAEQASENFDVFLVQKIKSVKVNTKKIEGSLRISFSRYYEWIKDTLMQLHHIKREAGIKA